MKLSYIFSLLPLVAANDGYLYEDRHHLRRALTAEGVGESCNHDTEAAASAACSDVQCDTDYQCATSCGVWTSDSCPAGHWCAKCEPNPNPPSNDYEVMETGDGWEDVDGGYILEEE